MIIFLNIFPFFLLKDLILSDIDADGYVELVVGLTDRVVRSYRWVEMGLGSSDDSASSDEDSDREPSGKLNEIFKYFFRQ